MASINEELIRVVEKLLGKKKSMIRVPKRARRGHPNVQLRVEKI